jgi:hypothetical protein
MKEGEEELELEKKDALPVNVIDVTDTNAN